MLSPAGPSPSRYGRCSGEGTEVKYVRPGGCMFKMSTFTPLTFALAMAAAAFQAGTGRPLQAQQQPTAQRPAADSQAPPRESLKGAPDRRAEEGKGPFKTLAIRNVMLIDGSGAPPAGPMDVSVS